MKPSLGEGARIDVARLVETRLLIQANSGGGKSYALRRLLEQIAPHVPWIVLDPEGEFRTLREEVDCVIAAPKDGDVVAAPHTAALLARRLLELRVHAVVDLYEMQVHERVLFVKRFCEALVDAPKTLWKPTVVVLDEAHVFAPQNGSAESRQAVMDLATRGRKRGFALCAATQRLSKLHKDVAAELLNKLVGRTGLDIDVKRANEELGFTKSGEQHKLRNLMPGQFYAFGPAFDDQISTLGVHEIRIGKVKSTHPKAGQRAIQKPPAPSRRLLKLLGKELADLPKQATGERLTLENAQRTISTLKYELARAQRGAPVAQVDVQAIEKKALNHAAHHYESLMRGMRKQLDDLAGGMGHVARIASRFTASGHQAGKHEAREIPAMRFDGPDRKQVEERVKNDIARRMMENVKLMPPVKPELDAMMTAAGLKHGGDARLRSGAMRILKELAARSPAGYSRSQVATLCGFAPNGGTFLTYISDLRRSGAIEERSGLVYASQAGCDLVGAVPMQPKTHEDIMTMWGKALRKGAFQMLQHVVDNPDDVSRETLAQAVDMAPNGGTFLTYLSDLRRNGLVVERDGMIRPSEILNP